MASSEGADGSPTGEPTTDGCHVCNQLRLEGPDEQTFVVVPADGYGWVAWSAALLRLFGRIGHQPTQAVIISEDPITARYAQVLIGHGIAHAEASSNVYLMGESRLTAGHEDLLAELGWSAPTSDEDDPDEMPANWHLPLIHGDWQYLVEMIVATIVGVFGFSEQAPVEVRSFAAENPCRACSWNDEGGQPIT